MAGKIFVNYRRDDSRDAAARVRDRLVQAFGTANVFMDVENLLVGQRFDKELEKALGQCDVFLAVMGPRWMDELARRQQSGERDYVREEIAAALARGTLAIPVMLERTPLPRADQLPPEIAPLVLHQKHDVAHESFGRDMTALIDGIRAARRASVTQPALPWGKIAAGMGGLVMAGALVLVGPALMGSDLQGLTPEQTAPRTLPGSDPAGLTPRSNDAKAMGTSDRAPKTEAAAEPENTSKATDKTASKAEEEQKRREARRNAERIAMLQEKGLASKAEADAAKAAATPNPGDTFRDCPECPEMVVVPAGEFMMGSPESEEGRNQSEGPRHNVRIEKPYAVGRFEVTFEEWDACVQDSICQRTPGDQSWGKGRRPVININWYEIQDFANWLQRKSGKRYRLLSESEWEYAARARNEDRYSWGSEIGQGKAVCSGCGSRWDDRQTAPVGTFEANGFGLHDMHGNVTEWVEDPFNNDYSGAPSDGTIAKSGYNKVHRGGGWNSYTTDIRSASRGFYTTLHRDSGLGFRVARDLD